MPCGPMFDVPTFELWRHGQETKTIGKIVDGFQGLENHCTAGTKAALESIRVTRFNALKLHKACLALHIESMITIGLTLKDKGESLKVLQKQNEKIIGETEDDLCDADFQADLLSSCRKRLG